MTIHCILRAGTNRFWNRKPQKGNDVAEMREGWLDMVTKNSIVAIVSGDVGEDYCLLNIISDHVETLTMNVMDD